MQIEHPEYFGQLLHSKGFRIWTKYMFQVIENKPFIEESLHADLFQVFQDIYDRKSNRDIINVPPRSGKTTLAKYFIAYCLAPNPRCNFIYTSYSQSLLGQISGELSTILQHPIYQSMYIWDFKEEEEELNSITGFGAGIRESKEYSGGIFEDDPNKPADIYSKIMRDKVLMYHEETLLSRPNDSSASITIIQQRLHKQDLTGLLTEIYEYNILKKALMVDGVCQLPNQYSEERLLEIMTNNVMFQAQYQQNPLNLGGNNIKPDVLKEYELLPFTSKRWITVDTGIKEGKVHDYTVLQCWGRADRGIYLIDQIRFKAEYPQLKKRIKAFWNKHNSREDWDPRQYGSLVVMGIEDKASGSQIIQEARAEAKIPILAIQRSKSKLERVVDILLPKLENGFIYVPANAPWLNDYKCEFEEFTGEDKHEHDDQIDCTIDGVEMGFTDMLGNGANVLAGFNKKRKGRKR